MAKRARKKPNADRIRDLEIALRAANTTREEQNDRLGATEASRDMYRDAARRARAETNELMNDVRTLQFALGLAYQNSVALRNAFRFTENADDLARDHVALAS